jgi:ABC-type transport system involved in multi-copper enzyme maturation permease subunit
MGLSEAIANSWQNILVLLVVTVALFGACYLLFTRMDLT